MNTSSPILLIGVGGAGCDTARGIDRAFGGELRHLLVDTDAKSGSPGGPFVLMGGDRLSGRGTGGDIVAGRMAAEDSLTAINDSLSGVRIAVIVTALGGGTGGGVTLELAQHLVERGISTVVFATTPFTFEGEDRQRNARGIMTMIEEYANATFFLPLDRLVGEIDNMDEALRHAIGTLASAITLFWRLVEKPGYIRLGVEDLRQLFAGGGRARFATAGAVGENRAAEIADRLIASKLLTTGSGPVKTIICGVLGGNDLRLSELGEIAQRLQAAFGEKCTFKLATVNDEATFSGRLQAVVMLLESSGEKPRGKGGDVTAPQSVLTNAPVGRGRFNNTEPNSWHGEDLDEPTFIRRHINLDL